MARRGAVAVALALLAAGVAPLAAADTPGGDNRGVLELLSRVDRMQQEVRQLRGAMEEQGHRIDELQERLRSLYGDMDQRVSRLEGSGGAASTSSAGSGGGAAATGGTTTAEPAAAAEPTAEERGAYEKAFGLLRDGRYPEAIEAFRAFLKAYPKGEYADNAQYWLGEAYYVSRNLPAAVEEYGKVVADFPQSAKVPDALLKSGYAEYDRQQWAAARKALEEVAKRFPDTASARLAQQRLEKMGKEGH